MTVKQPPRPAAFQDAAAIALELEKIFSVITAAHRLMESDRLVDLGALDGRVRDVCDAVGRLPASEAQPLTAQLETLLAQLDGLGSALHGRFGDLPILPNHSASTAAGAYADMLKHFP